MEPGRSGAMVFRRAAALRSRLLAPSRQPRRSTVGMGARRSRICPLATIRNCAFSQEPSSAEEWSRLATDVVFVGGADRDRVPFLEAVIQTGVQVALYGGYWDRFAQTRLPIAATPSQRLCAGSRAQLKYRCVWYAVPIGMATSCDHWKFRPWAGACWPRTPTSTARCLVRRVRQPRTLDHPRDAGAIAQVAGGRR